MYFTEDASIKKRFSNPIIPIFCECGSKLSGMIGSVVVVCLDCDSTYELRKR